VALALLKVCGLSSFPTSFAICCLFQTSRKDLLCQDFEGVLKYFRVQLPKKYRNEDNAHELLNVAINLKVGLAFFAMTF
jgi:hypothetical protein